jgi:hypothetical protein
MVTRSQYESEKALATSNHKMEGGTASGLSLEDEIKLLRCQEDILKWKKKKGQF